MPRECWRLAGFEISGAFLLESDPDGLLVAGSGQVLLGSLGDVTAEGGLKIESEQRDANSNVKRPGNAAGFFILGAGIGIDGILEIDGEVQLQFNTFAVPITFDVPRFNDDPIYSDCRCRTVLQCESERAGGSGDARLSLLPAGEIPRIFVSSVLTLAGNFELINQQNALHLDFQFTASLTVANFDNAAIGSVSGMLDIVDGKVIGEFDGSLTVAGLTVQNGVKIDEFGCITLDEPILGISNFGCKPNIFVPDQRLLEDDPVVTIPLIGEFRQRVSITNNAPQPHRIGVTYRVEDNSARHGIDYIGDLSGTVFIEPNRTGKMLDLVPIDNPDPLPQDLDFTVEVTDVFYADAEGREISPFLAPPLNSVDRPGTITIADDDRLETGPPVTVNVKLADSIFNPLPGEPIVFDVNEDDGPVRLEFSAPSLQAGDSVIVEAFVTPTADPAIPTTDSDDVRLRTTSRIFGPRVVLQGNVPSVLEIPITPDTTAELDEQFSLRLIVRRPALFAPSTSLRNDQITFMVINDDPEITADAVTFHNFDQQVIQPGIPPVIGWGFTAEPQFTTEFVTVSPLSHSSDSTIDSPGVPKIEPGALHGLATRGAGSDQWAATSDLLTGNLIGNPVARRDSATGYVWKGPGPTDRCLVPILRLAPTTSARRFLGAERPSCRKPFRSQSLRTRFERIPTTRVVRAAPHITGHREWTCGTGVSRQSRTSRWIGPDAVCLVNQPMAETTADDRSSEIRHRSAGDSKCDGCRNQRRRLL